MATQLKITLAQINLTVGDIAGNTEKIITATKQARDQQQADLVVFHELAITNYSPEDLLYHQDFYQDAENALLEIAKQTTGIDIIIGFPEASGEVSNPLNRTRFNSVAWLREGKVIAKYQKQCLPNYAVFDEKRYFTPGNQTIVVELNDIKIGLVICEDLWHSEPIQEAKQAGAEIIVSPNASPFSTSILDRRIHTLKNRCKESKLPIIYVNQLGGHDELLFDGNSMVMDSEGDISLMLPHCQEALQTITMHKEDSKCLIEKQTLPEAMILEEKVYRALVLGTRDYVLKNGFTGAILGLSGGIDSALTLAIAVDALGKENVTALFMPSRYTSQLSHDAALAEIKALGVKHDVIEIDKMVNQFLLPLNDVFKQDASNITQQNIQARVRGLLLMAISNQTDRIVLSTGNKSEMAVGYCTLYGDMVGGFAVLKDVYKTLVYKLAHYRNSLSPVIPPEVITRAPSAELAPDQKDEDSLPPYDTLDKILECYIEKNDSIEEIIAKNFADDTTVKRVISMLVHNEYKRRQAPPGTRITSKGFGRDWRYPITSRYC